MIFDSYLDWLGFKTRRPVVGVSITSTYVTVVALRRRPLRLVAIGHCAVPDDAVVDNEIRLIRPVVQALRSALANARIEPGSPTFAVVEPLSDTVSIVSDGANNASGSPTCDVVDRAYDAVASVVAEAGLGLRLLEPTPAALARIGLLAGAPAVALDASGGWAAVHGSGRLEAKRLSGATGLPALRLGADITSMAAVAAVPGIEVPPDLGHHHDPGRDAVAIGVAAAAFERGAANGVRIIARPIAPAVGSGWTVQRIDRPHSAVGKEGS